MYGRWLCFSSVFCCSHTWFYLIRASKRIWIFHLWDPLLKTTIFFTFFNFLISEMNSLFGLGTRTKVVCTEYLKAGLIGEKIIHKMIRAFDEWGHFRRHTITISNQRLVANYIKGRGYLSHYSLPNLHVSCWWLHRSLRLVEEFVEMAIRHVDDRCLVFLVSS